MLRTQLKRLQDDLRRVERHVEKGQREKAILEEKIGEGEPDDHINLMFTVY